MELVYAYVYGKQYECNQENCFAVRSSLVARTIMHPLNSAARVEFFLQSLVAHKLPVQPGVNAGLA